MYPFWVLTELLTDALFHFRLSKKSSYLIKKNHGHFNKDKILAYTAPSTHKTKLKTTMLFPYVIIYYVHISNTSKSSETRQAKSTKITNCTRLQLIRHISSPHDATRCFRTAKVLFKECLSQCLASYLIRTTSMSY